MELDISVSDSAHLYRAGPSIVFLRFPRGSAIITTKLQKGESVRWSRYVWICEVLLGRGTRRKGSPFPGSTQADTSLRLHVTNIRF